MAEHTEVRVDLDLRLVRCFTVVADHLHFGRAAAALYLTQPSLSRHIYRLEEHVGVRLLDRTPQGTRLTDAGEAFLPRARALLEASAAATSSAHAAAHAGRITIGFATDIIVTPAVRDLRRRHPDAEVHTLHLDWNEPRAALLDGRVDAVVARPPIPTEDVQVTVLYDEPRVLLVPRGHRLAGKEAVTLEDFADEPLPRMPDPAWNAFWCLDPRPDGRPAPDGPLIETMEDKLELVAGGQAVCLAPAGVLANTLRADVTVVPVEDIEPGQVVLLTRPDDHNPLLGGLRESVRNHLVGHPASSGSTEAPVGEPSA